MKKELQDTREDYQKGILDESLFNEDPLQQFKDWYRQYEKVNQLDTNAMTLSTYGLDGFPSSRVVLLKGVDAGGFEFYTNYLSHKGQEMASDNRVALTFYWPQLERQVRVTGYARQLEDEESDAYFRTRPYGSRIGAWVSPQSEVIPGREVLEKRQKEFEAKFPEDVPRPPHWGGYRVMPVQIEFWQGRSSRLHDRISYSKEGDSWRRERLAP